jgi:hypothetical protein
MKIEEKKLKKPNHEKNRLKFWKNQPVRFDFGFISLKPNRTEPKPKKTEKKPSQNPNRKNRAKPVWIGFCPKKPNRNKSIWTSFCSVSVLF